MVLMLTKIRQQQNLILEILKSREIIDGSDAAAFESVLTDDDKRNEALYQQTSQIYESTAKILGVKVSGL